MRTPHKYGAKPTIVDGIRFASTKEAHRFAELKLLQMAGEIHALDRQPRFPLFVPAHGNGGPYERACIGEYRADFSYCTCKRGAKCIQSMRVVEDVKGFKTPLYKWKKKHVEAQYGITIREV